MLWEVEVRGLDHQVDREGLGVLEECRVLALDSIDTVTTARSFILESQQDESEIRSIADGLLVDGVIECCSIRQLPDAVSTVSSKRLLNVLFKPGVTDNVANSTLMALRDLGHDVDAVATCRKFWINQNAEAADVERLKSRVLSNEAIEQVVEGPLQLSSIEVGSEYKFELRRVAIREKTDEELKELSRSGQLYLNLVEMQTIQTHFRQLERDPTDIELETIAQTWSEHCSHKTLAGRIHYVDENGERHFENMLKETIFAATMHIRERLGEDDWCVSVFEDNAGIVKFDASQNVCFKVETHNHPSALEPYGGANTGIGGVIRDPLGTGLGARPVCNTDVFCFAPPDTTLDSLPPGVLHPRVVARGVVAGVRDYGNRMGIPTVNGAVYFDHRYLGNPLVYCGNVAMIPENKCEKYLQPGHLVVAVGGRTGRDGIHGATFSSSELTEDSEMLSGGAVQIGNPITEKMVADVILQARDAGLYSAITDCGAGGFSSAVGEMGEETGAEVWLEKCPLKYSGLSYTEIWISEAQERMVLAVPEENWETFRELCESEGVEATAFGRFTDSGKLVLKYHDQVVGQLTMRFLHDGRPPVIREARYELPAVKPWSGSSDTDDGPRVYDEPLAQILGSLNVASKEWIIRQYDHEVQGGSVIKPLVGICSDGPSDAAVVRPDLESNRGIVIANGMNPHLGDLDTYWMAASAIDEAVRNCVAVGADPDRIAILDNFCWGNTDQPETLGSLVRSALACQDVAIAFGTPFISGKDSLNNEFAYSDDAGNKTNVAIPPSLLISAMGQVDDIQKCVTMDFKQAGNRIYQVGLTLPEMGGSHFNLVTKQTGGQVPQVDLERAPRTFAAMHSAIEQGLIASCHDLSEGGLAVGLAESAFSGGLGVDVDLAIISEAMEIEDPAMLLFAESNSRFLCEVSEDCADEFEEVFADLPLARLGTVTECGRIRVRKGSGPNLIDADGAQLKDCWQAPLDWDVHSVADA